MRQVAVVCRAPSSRFLAPIENPDWELWLCSPMKGQDEFCDLPRWDRWYEIHDHAYIERQIEQECPGHGEWLARMKKERPADVFLRDDVPMDDLAHYGCDYLTSSPAIMLAHAVYEGVDKIGLYGCDMAQDTEYRYQRPCVEFWLGLAKGAGIELVIPDECDLLKASSRYGDRYSAVEIKLQARETELEQRVQSAQQHLDERRNYIAACIGAKEESNHWREHWSNGHAKEDLEDLYQKRTADLEQSLKVAEAQTQKIDADRNQLLGCLQELQYQRQLQ